MNELKTITTGKGTYDSFPDQTARETLGKIPEGFKTKIPGEIGQIFEITSVDENGNVTGIQAVDKPTSGQDTVRYTAQTLTEEQQMQARANLGVYGSTAEELFSGVLTFVGNTATYYGLIDSSAVETGDALVITVGTMRFEGTVEKVQTGPSDWDVTAHCETGSQTCDYSHSGLVCVTTQNLNGEQEVTISVVTVNSVPAEYLPDDLLRDTDLDGAVNDALAQAKERGEFDGAPGADGLPGEAATLEITEVTALAYGAAPTVTEVEGSTAQARKIILGIPAGKPGDSYTLTDDDRTEIARLVIEDLGGRPVYGYVEEDTKSVVLMNAPSGEYTYYYEMEDGTRVLIGVPAEDNNTYYAVTNTLTNCVSDNDAVQAVEGGSYSATISANSGYELESVTVTMGGEDITESAVSGGTISIASVTGDIVITAVAEAKAAEPVTVDIPLTDGIRIGSDGTDRTLAGYCATSHIDLTNIPKPCIINLTNATWCYNESSTQSAVRTYAANTSGEQLVSAATKESISNEYITVAINERTGGDSINDGGKDVSVTVTSDEVATIRFSGYWAVSSLSDINNNGNTMAATATLTYTPGT